MSLKYLSKPDCCPAAVVVTMSRQHFMRRLRYGWQRRTESLTCKPWESKEVRSLPTCASKSVLETDIWVRGDAWTLFKLLDEEACGSISKDAWSRVYTKHLGPQHRTDGASQSSGVVAKAFVDGCLCLRGSASGSCSVDFLLTARPPRLLRCRHGNVAVRIKGNARTAGLARHAAGCIDIPEAAQARVDHAWI